MSLAFNTSALKWVFPEGQKTIKINNATQVRFAIKIKITNVDAYKTTPNTDFVNPGFTLNLVVVRKKAPMKEDKLEINYVECEFTDNDAVEVFKRPGLKPNVYMITMKCAGTPPLPGGPDFVPVAQAQRAPFPPQLISSTKIILIFKLHDEDGETHRMIPLKFNLKATFEKLLETISSSWAIKTENILLYRKGEQISNLDSTLQEIDVKQKDEIIIKHTHLQFWNPYKNTVEKVLKQKHEKVENAKKAIEYHEKLSSSDFFEAYTKFNDYRELNHAKIAAWTDGVVSIIREATENYFRNLHDDKRGKEDSKFICYFDKRSAELGGRPTNTLAYVQIYGEDSVSKYYVKCHHNGPKSQSSGRFPDVIELYCYLLLSTIGVCPKVYIIPPLSTTGTKTSTYIATQWDDRFEMMKKVLDEKTLSVDVGVQLVVLRTLLFISDLHEENCGIWKGTKRVAIVDFAPTNDVRVHDDIKKELAITFPYSDWKNEYKRVKSRLTENDWLKIAKKYIKQWNLRKKIEVAREQLDPTKGILKSLEIGFKTRNSRISPTDQLIEYIDILCKNLESLETLLNSV